MIKLLSTLTGALMLTIAFGVATPASAETTTISTPAVQIADGHLKSEMKKKARKFPKNVAARKKAFKAMSKGMKGIKKARKTKNKKLLVASANRIAKASAYLHKNVDKLFSKQTAKVKGTRAKPAIWKKWRKFKAGFTTLRKASDGLVKASMSGKGVGKAFKAVGKSCGSCHKPFRFKKKKKKKM